MGQRLGSVWRRLGTLLDTVLIKLDKDPSIGANQYGLIVWAFILFQLNEQDAVQQTLDDLLQWNKPAGEGGDAEVALVWGALAAGAHFENRYNQTHASPLYSLTTPEFRNQRSSGAPAEHNNSQRGGCYVATAVYGSYDCPEVWVLRRYRDDYLHSHALGRAFIRVYYAVSPLLVRFFGKTARFRSVLKPILDSKVASLRARGVQDIPYHDSLK